MDGSEIEQPPPPRAMPIWKQHISKSSFSKMGEGGHIATTPPSPIYLCPEFGQFGQKKVQNTHFSYIEFKSIGYSIQKLSGVCHSPPCQEMVLFKLNSVFQPPPLKQMDVLWELFQFFVDHFYALKVI